MLRRQEPVECPGALAAVDDAQRLGLGGQPLRQRLPAQPPCTGKGHAAEVLVEIGGAGAELLYGQGGGKRPELRLQGGLGGGTQHRRGAEVRHELSDGRHAGPQVFQGEHLRLVKDEHAIGTIVELAALGGAAGVQGLEELYRRGHHHRRVEILRRQGLPVLGRGGLVLRVPIYAGMVFHYVALPQNVPKDGRVLFDNGGIGNDVDHPVQPVGDGVAEGEGQGGHGLTASGGHRESVQAPGAVSAVQAGAQDLASAAVQVSFGRPPTGDMPFQALQQHGQGVVPAPGRRRGAQERLRIQVIAVHQAGVEHPDEKRVGQRVPAPKGRRRGRRQAPGPGGVVGNAAGQAPFQAAYQGEQPASSRIEPPSGRPP